MRNTNPLVVQRETQRRQAAADREKALMKDQDNDPRRREARRLGQYDQARLHPLIEDEE